MCEFRRTRSKVWWSNYFHEDDETDDIVHHPSLSRSTTSRFSWRRSLVEDSSRNSSSSPSNGSHKSQDSGFSDSESSSPSSCGSKSDSDNRVKSDESCDKCASDESKNDESPNSPTESTLSKLPEIPVRISRPHLLRYKKRDRNQDKNEKNLQLVKSKCNSISSYLADCYFPINDFVNEPKTPKAELPCAETSSQRCTLSRSQTCHSLYSESSADESRTCFIVDELPKLRSPSLENIEKTPLGSTDTLSSSSFENNDTVRFLDKKDPPSGRCSPELRAVEQKDLPCLNVDLLKKNDHNETLDLSLLPEPAHSSTPKKDEVKLRAAKKIRSPSPVTVEDNKPIDPPVARWLRESRYRYEPECMTTLQAKSISQCCKRNPSTMVVWDSVNSVLTFQHRTKLIANEFLKLKINICTADDTSSHIQGLINNIMEFIIGYSQLLPRMESNDKENLLKLMDMGDRLRQIINTSIDQSALLNEINILEKFFSRFVDSVLIQQITLLSSILENPSSEITLLNALSSISTLSTNTSRVSELITHFNGIQNLLSICAHSISSINVRTAALRTLAAVCQNSVSIRQLEKAGGIEILSRLLSDEDTSENERLEVVSVLVQITAPWIEDGHVIKGLVYHLYPIIESLTRLIERCESCETLLLSSAALANITFIEPQAVFVLLQLDTARCLLTSVRNLGVRASVFLQEQVATLIANMAAVPETRPHLAQHRAVGALLCFLQVKHSPIQTAAEISAAERLQHKSAIALSRLCTNPEIAKQVIELQGVTRLVRLCREERERNYSDGVLVACLASLRKITAVCGNDVIDKLDAKELVEPRLVDSFLLYSSRQESYV
ncbi:protein inscuteable homolog isoform X2 [Planococcus citri]|uniref:protein inscuteable homolog isoform X2 n=1 Tax=Planococcus citri TaxID=170843 RepID=UPI0031F80682